MSLCTVTSYTKVSHNSISQHYINTPCDTVTLSFISVVKKSFISFIYKLVTMFWELFFQLIENVISVTFTV
ncbi:hypothetical protein EB796_015661 [Bugula neritina]|uniref:Uncharacterized protein n=1 Tax=Bugula neritina TaxID=10212 RepID=A0A7J7JJQ0_BUGNE|nr:hypothetical protein EB796_015661 [Bugula neritina]